MNIERWANTRLGSGIVAGNGNEYRVNCPFCRARIGHEDEKYHMYINLVKPFALCFRCDWKGHYSQLVMSVEGCNYVESLSYIGNPLPDIGRFDKLKSPLGLVQAPQTCMPPGFIPFTGHRNGSMEGDAALVYVKKRLGIRSSYASILMERFGYVPGTNRVWMLIDEWFWQGRSLTNGSNLKYVSPPWPKNDSLWNAEALDSYEDVTVCEGVFSAYRAGPDNAMALCGKKATNAQVERIVAKKPQSITIMLDAGAYLESLHLAGALMLAGYNGNVILHSLRDGDPADGLAGKTEAYDWSKHVVAELSAI